MPSISTTRRLAALPLMAALVLGKPAFEGPKPPLRRIVDTPDLLNSTTHFDNLIVGGAPADRASSTFTVALVTEYRGELFQFCGGTLIKPRFVVTAAHCVEAGYTMKAIVGRYKLSDASQGQIIDVTESFVFPTYDPESMAGDIAILRLASPVPASVATPINLMPESLGNTVQAGTSLRVLGWGLMAEEAAHQASKGGEAASASGSDTLRSVDVPVVSNADCNQEYHAVTDKNPILDEQVCAGIAQGGLDSCQGDSGGPLVAFVGSDAYLFGVVSWGIGCARANIPGVYTRVLSHANWVTSKMMLQTSLFAAKAQPGNLLITGTDKAAILPVTFESLASELLTIQLSFLNASSAFSTDKSHFDLTQSDSKSSVVISYKSSEPKIEPAFLQLGLGGEANGELYNLKGLALGPASFGNLTGWYSGGNEVWVAEQEAGVISSGQTKNSETACALTYFKGQGTVTFDWKVSSEQGYDIFYTIIDNLPVDAITGVTDYVTKTYDLPAGKEHALAFCYIKDHSVGEGEDKGWVKNVAFAPAAAAPAAAAAAVKVAAPAVPEEPVKHHRRAKRSNGLRGRKGSRHSGN